MARVRFRGRRWSQHEFSVRMSGSAGSLSQMHSEMPIAISEPSPIRIQPVVKEIGFIACQTFVSAADPA
jgi:hypothetical protein